MTDNNENNIEIASDRRDFIKKAGQAAVVAPAVGVLLSAQSRGVLAQAVSGGQGGSSGGGDPCLTNPNDPQCL